MRLRFLVSIGLLMLTPATGQQAGSSDNSENDPDHAVKVSDDILWHLELDDIAYPETRKFVRNVFRTYGYLKMVQGWKYLFGMAHGR